MDASGRRSRVMHWCFLVVLVQTARPTFGQCPEQSELRSRITWKGFGSAGPALRTTPLLAPSKPELIELDQRTKVIASPWSYRSLGVFCKAEVKMNRWFPIPVMVRLGDVQRAEELDGKGADRGPR